MTTPAIHFLTGSSTYQELALRSQEFLYYQQYMPDSESWEIAEACFFNLMVDYIGHLGMPRREAEAFCDNLDNLTELAMRICSTLGAAA